MVDHDLDLDYIYMHMIIFQGVPQTLNLLKMFLKGYIKDGDVL